MCMLFLQARLHKRTSCQKSGLGTSVSPCFLLSWTDQVVVQWSETTEEPTKLGTMEVFPGRKKLVRSDSTRRMDWKKKRKEKKDPVVQGSKLWAWAEGCHGRPSRGKLFPSPVLYEACQSRHKKRTTMTMTMRLRNCHCYVQDWSLKGCNFTFWDSKWEEAQWRWLFFKKKNYTTLRTAYSIEQRFLPALSPRNQNQQLLLFLPIRCLCRQCIWRYSLLLLRTQLTFSSSWRFCCCRSVGIEAQ